jgi:hypothetical protein
VTLAIDAVFDAIIFSHNDQKLCVHLGGSFIQVGTSSTLDFSSFNVP